MVGTLHFGMCRNVPKRCVVSGVLVSSVLVSYKVLDTEAPMLALPLRLPTAPYGGHMGHFLDFCFFSRARVFFGLPEDPFAILVVLDEPHWGCALRFCFWLRLCVCARSCSGHSWTAVAGMCMMAGALRRRHGDRLRLGAEVGGRLLFIPSAPRLSNPPMSLLRCT